MSRNQLSLALATPPHWTGVTLAELLDRFIDAASKRVEPNSLRTMRVHLAAVKRISVGGRPLVDYQCGELGPVELQQMHDQLADGTAIGCRRAVQLVAQAWRWGSGPSRGLIPLGAANPCDQVEIKPYRSNVPEVSGETVRLLWLALEHVKARPQVIAFLRVLLLTGLRPWSEALPLQCSQLYRSGKRWALRFTKHKTANKRGTKVLSLGERAAAILLEQRELVGGRGNMWPCLGGMPGERMNKDSPRRAWKKLVAKAMELGDLDERIYVYCLRHGFATAALESGAALTDVQSALGHDNAQTTFRYARGVPGREGETADRMVLHVIEGKGCTVEDLAALIGCDPSMAAVFTALQKANRVLGVTELMEVESMEIQRREATVSGEWSHQRFILACRAAGIRIDSTAERTKGPTQLAEIVTRKRKALGSTKPAMDTRTADRYLSGERAPDRDTAVDLADALGVSLDWLFTRDEFVGSLAREATA